MIVMDCFCKRECSICLSNLNMFNAYKLYCGHQYHYSCIQKWLIRSNNCPKCRYELSPYVPEYLSKSQRYIDTYNKIYAELLKDFNIDERADILDKWKVDSLDILPMHKFIKSEKKERRLMLLNARLDINESILKYMSSQNWKHNIKQLIRLQHLPSQVNILGNLFGLPKLSSSQLIELVS